jgi:hypothetical protein
LVCRFRFQPADMPYMGNDELIGVGSLTLATHALEFTIERKHQ